MQKSRKGFFKFATVIFKYIAQEISIFEKYLIGFPRCSNDRQFMSFQIHSFREFLKRLDFTISIPFQKMFYNK